MLYFRHAQVTVFKEEIPIKTVTLEQAKRATALCLAADVPVAIWGDPGVGKSTMIREMVAELGWKLYDFRLSDKEPSDLGGIPYPDGEKVKYLQPLNLPFDSDEKALVFWDEADRAELPVLNVVLQYWLDKSCNGHKFGPNVRQVLAGNATTDVGTTPLSRAAANRVVHLHIETRSQKALDSYLHWAENNDVSPVLRSFAQFRQEVWHGGDSKAPMTELAFPSPRSFDYADRLIRVAAGVDFPTEDIMPAVISGCVGEGAATEFLAHFRLYNETPPIEEILREPGLAAIPEKPDIMYALSLSLVDYASGHEDAVDALTTYGLRWPAEPKANFFRRMLAKQPKTALSPAYREWDAANRGVRLDTGAEKLTDVTNLTPEVSLALKDGKAVLMPSNDQWDIRFQVPSASNPNRPHVVARRRQNASWACDCSGWIRHRSCKHLTGLGLK